MQAIVFPPGLGPTPRPEPTAVRLGTNYSLLAGVNGSFDLFNPTTQADKRFGQKSEELEQANTEKLTQDTKQAILQAYYSVLLNQEKARFSAENLKRTEQYLTQGRVQFENRTILKTDLDRLQLDYQNAQVTQAEDEKNLQLSRLYLGKQIGAEANATVEATESLESVMQSLPDVGGLQNTFTRRVEFKQEQLRLDQSQLNAARQGKAYLPTVSLYGSWNAQHLSNNFEPFAANTWFPFSYAGLRVSATLFDGLLRERTRTEYRHRAEQNRNNLAKLQSDLNYEWESARVQLLNAHEKLKTARDNYALAQSVVQTDNLRFQEGKITAADLRNTEYSLATAQNNLLTNYYNFLVAKIAYQKAVGEL
ncbi:MAG: TolC family protein [Cytophagales bacterium]|nr:TolC family protein [Cytophagales bacterium]